jgi:hypothetical protein
MRVLNNFVARRLVQVMNPVGDPPKSGRVSTYVRQQRSVAQFGSACFGIANLALVHTRRAATSTT